MRRLLPVNDRPDSDEDDPFAVYRAGRRPGGDRPWVVANMVAGIDGSTSIDGRVGALSSDRDHELFVVLRSLVDVVLIGAGTARAEGYGPVRLASSVQDERVATGRRPIPPLAVVTRSLNLDWDAALFSPDAPSRPIVITAAAAGETLIAQARERADVIIAGEQSVDLGLALADLHRRGMDTLLTEGGPTLLGKLMAGGLLDELCLTLAPLAGGDPLPVAVRPTGRSDLVGFELSSVLEEGGQLFLRYTSMGGPT